MVAAVDDPGRDDVWNSVAVASVAYQQEMLQLSWVMTCAMERGMSFSDLGAASGLSEGFITYLLSEFS